MADRPTTTSVPDLDPDDRATYLRKIGTICALSVVAWASFATLFRLAYPTPVEPDDPLGVWWLWLVAGTAGFVLVVLGLLRLLHIPTRWRTHAVLAFSAPALVCDMWTGTQTESWLPDAGAAGDRLYLSFIVGGVGLIQLMTLVAEIPGRGRR